jgi:hypothetical protein
VRNDGKMEGTIYTVPFHQHIQVTSIDPTGKTPIDQIPPGSQIELTGQGATEVSVYRHGIELADLAASLKGNFRYTLRFPERSDGITIRVSGTVLEATLQSPQAADIHIGRHRGQPHQGGINFDTL